MKKSKIGGKIAALRTGLLNGFQRMKYRKKLGVICFLTGMLPLSVMGIFCYQQTVRLLYTREYRAMDSTLQTAVASTDTQIRVYEGASDLSGLLQRGVHHSLSGCFAARGYLFAAQL